MAEYYKVDGREITLRECRNISRSWTALVAWSAARLGVPIQSGVAFRQPESVAEMEVPESELSPQARAKSPPMREPCRQAGLRSPRVYPHPTVLTLRYSRPTTLREMAPRLVG